MTEVLLNGKYVGDVDSGTAFVNSVRDARRKSALSANVNVLWDETANRVVIESGRGRLRRPVIVVQNGIPLLTEKHIKQLQKKEISWNDLVSQGVIEYLDAAEEENALVAFFEHELTPEHTHLEMSPLAMLGLSTALIPFGHNIQSARLIIGARNLKQSVGFYAANFPVRMDMDVNLLCTPQVPIVQTVMHELSDYDKHPSGQNIVVAVMSYKGYNIEDAIILNKGSIDRGFARSIYFRPAVAEELRYSGGLMDEICIPDKEVKGYKSERDYRLLEDDGRGCFNWQDFSAEIFEFVG